MLKLMKQIARMEYILHQIIPEKSDTQPIFSWAEIRIEENWRYITEKNKCMMLVPVEEPPQGMQ